MAINFIDSPINGDTVTADGRTYAYDSTAGVWKINFVSGSNLTAVVEDITPQLGGNLDVNGQTIVSANNGNISITPDGTGQIVLGGLNLVTAGTYSQGTASYFTKQYVLNGTTTDATEGELLIAGTTSRISVPINSTMLYEVSIVARRTDVTGESASWHLKGCADNFSDTVSNVGNIYEIAVAADDVSWVVDTQADDVNNALNILVTGAAGKTIRWTAVVKTIEVSE